jgi:hypothetical protein
MSFRSTRLDVVGVTVGLSATLRISALHILTVLVLLGVLLPVCRGVRPPAYSVRITTIDTLATAAHLVLSPSQSNGTHRMRGGGTGRRVAALLLSSGGALAINTRPMGRTSAMELDRSR